MAAGRDFSFVFNERAEVERRGRAALLASISAA